jgi:hypothetical protein
MKRYSGHTIIGPSSILLAMMASGMNALLSRLFTNRKDEKKAVLKLRTNFF